MAEIVLNRDILKEKIESLKKENKKIVFTNGCFDIIHPGHVDYLRKAKALGSILVVGVNSDISVKRIKGKNRPINNESDRLAVLSAFSCIDYLTLFEEDTPYNLIALIQPDVLVKGGDWAVNSIVGKDIVEQNGGEVLNIEFLPGYSTTSIIQKIKNLV